MAAGTLGLARACGCLVLLTRCHDARCVASADQVHAPPHRPRDPPGGLIQHEDGGVDEQLVADGHALALASRDAPPEEPTCAVQLGGSVSGNAGSQVGVASGCMLQQCFSHSTNMPARWQQSHYGGYVACIVSMCRLASHQSKQGTHRAYDAANKENRKKKLTEPMCCCVGEAAHSRCL
jgi:hypothetical protein